MSKNNITKILALVLCLSFVMATPASASFGTESDAIVDNSGRDGGTVDRSEPSSTQETNTGTNDFVPADEAEAEREKAVATVAKKKSENDEERAKLQSDMKDLKDGLAELKAEEKAIKQQLNNAKGTKQEVIATKNALQQDLNNVLATMDLLEQKIVLLNESIKQAEEDIEYKKKEMNETILQLRKRIATSYRAGYSSALSVVLGADSYYDSLMRTKIIAQVSARDQELLQILNDQKVELEQKEAALKQDKEDLKADKKDLDDNKGALTGKISAAQAKVEDISKLEQEYANDLAESKKKAAEMESEMQNVLSAIANLSSSATSTYDGGVMQWPLPGFSTISSQYGWRFGNSDFHTGVDITGGGCYGSSIVAAADGKVVTANLAYTPGRSYGIYVIIDHGGGVISLYGHCSALLVSEGQQVVRGQQIAKVGSTGWSTGAHLHFEVRKDNQHTNPIPYLKG